MTRDHSAVLTTAAELLLDTYRLASKAGIGAGVALYLVRLSEVAGWSLAVAIHEAAGGPDPLVLRARAQSAGVSAPVMAASVRADVLASVLEGLAALDVADRGLLGWAVREVSRSGEVPALVILGDTVIHTTLARLMACSDDAVSFVRPMPAAGEA